MIELGRHIEILLFSNDCVIVPDLGGFMAYHVDARYDEGESLFLPPARTLGFNPQLKLNDSLLAQSYIETYDISYPEATRRIEEEVSELKQHLCNECSYKLEDIGTLHLNDEGNYIFEPCEAGILTPCLYGLNSFEMKRIPAAGGTVETAADSTHTDGTVQTGKHGGKTAASAERQDTVVPKTHAIEAEEETEKEERTIKIKVAWLRNAAAIAAAMLAFFFMTPQITNSDNPCITASSLQEQMFMGMINKDAATAKSADIEPVKTKETAAAHDTTASTRLTQSVETKADTIKQAKKDSAAYCIVMASHITRRNAETYVNELHASGLDEAYTYEHNKIMRVVYGRYESKQEAQAVLRTIRGNKHFEQSWVYKKR